MTLSYLARQFMRASFDGRHVRLNLYLTRVLMRSHRFFAAHLHHALEWFRQGHAPRTVMAGVIFQIAYTSIFGAFAAFVQLRTGTYVRRA